QIALIAHDPDGDALTLRIVDPPQHGNAALTDTTARYIPQAGFSGQDSFTFTAWDGSTDGTLATVTVDVSGTSGAGDCTGEGRVRIDDLLRGVNIALGLAAVDSCEAFDTNGDGSVTIDELTQAVNTALGNCPA